MVWFVFLNFMNFYLRFLLNHKTLKTFHYY